MRALFLFWYISDSQRISILRGGQFINKTVTLEIFGLRETLDIFGLFFAGIEHWIGQYL